MVEPLRFLALHVSSKDLKVLRSLLGLSGGNSQQSWTVADDADSGDAVLVDVDNPDGAAIWPEISQQQRLPIALSKRRDFPARLLLHKPIRSQQLIRLLADLSNVAQDPTDPDEWKVLAFGDDSAELPLAEHLRRHNWEQPVLVGGDYLPELVIDSGAGVWYSSASDRELARLLRRNFRRDEAQVLSSSELINHTNGLEQQSLANLKWRSGLALSSSALHPDLAGSVRFMLPQVPLQALSDTAYSRQARILIRQPMTASELVENARAGQDDVAEFLNACHACGFLLIDSGAKVSAGR
ncbi:MAG: hypothetical protein RQ741_01150 [Wenzhouxiangellaceae bacterium]|nr:hypothetical protein [Wenzhouxiangellaceae bacterium]